jgi:hypothetical protein
LLSFVAEDEVLQANAVISKESSSTPEEYFEMVKAEEKAMA